MVTLRKKTDGIVNHHTVKAARAAAVKQRWHERMMYAIGREILRDKRFSQFNSYFDGLSHWGWNEEYRLHEKIEKDRSLMNLARELDIRAETLVNSILFAAYIDQEYSGSFEEYWEEVGEVWFHSELARLRPETQEEGKEPEIGTASGGNLKTARSSVHSL